MAVPTKEYPMSAPVDVEALIGVRFEFTPDGQPCQIHVRTSKGRNVTLNPGSEGDVDFLALWQDAVPSQEALQAIFDAAPNMTDEERGVAVAAPEPE
ncbi:MAG: hypothetical protein ACYTBJ_01635 [Planctomycetota bacterium]|jgi:hypothetical protein